MTYRELLESLSLLTEVQLDMNVSIRDVYQDEYYPATNFYVETETDVLDENHPVITFVG